MFLEIYFEDEKQQQAHEPIELEEDKETKPEDTEKPLEEEKIDKKFLGKNKLLTTYLDRIKELEAKVREHEEHEKTMQHEQNRKFLTAIQKKSEEAAELIKLKEKEIEEKYAKKLEENKKFLYESQLSDLVNIVSQLENVINSEPKNEEVKKYLLGFRMFLSQFESLFESLNIEVIAPSINQEFDSELMESLSTEAASGEESKNKILSVFSKGYKLNNRVIKLAQVKVAV
ncbi:co-chaperone GrpE [Candidatus Mycoplasma haematolamae str. Purdue]|uniref:Protein GrpE n=1 Tax=Mycoplasma haematolamae (strain Purdue) TaxID=1212765 RepID=I7CJL4_MYCHA|nr:nucleotide exchange factor GrpE [Candidatus Mycoplasma haematolamae]AFO52049.1 co-chaperone GrpE [Candidatus Mycoplasma haematolamae str. Purdue]